LDDWLTRTSAQRSFDQVLEDNLPPWVSEQAPEVLAEPPPASLPSSLGRVFEEEEELVFPDSIADKIPQQTRSPHLEEKLPLSNLNEDYSIIACKNQKVDDEDDRETAFRTATSSSLSPITTIPCDPTTHTPGNDSQDTVAYNADDSDSLLTASYNGDDDSQDTIPYNVDDPPSDSEVQEPSNDFQGNGSREPPAYNQHPIVDDPHILQRDDHCDTYSDSWLFYMDMTANTTNPQRTLSPSHENVEQINELLSPSFFPQDHDSSEPADTTSPLRISSPSHKRVEPVDEPLSPSSFPRVRDSSEIVLPSLHNTLEEEESDDLFDDIAEEDMLELMKKEVEMTSQVPQSKKRAHIPVHLESTPEKKQLKSSLGTKPAPIDNYFFHSSSSLKSTKDIGNVYMMLLRILFLCLMIYMLYIEEDIGKSTLTPSFTVSSSFEKVEKTKPKPQDTRRRPRIGLSKTGSK
jgi:hypothetical protein